MKRVLSSGSAAVMAAWMFAGCYSNNKVGNNALSVSLDGGGASDGAGAAPLATNIRVEIDGMTSPVGCSNGQWGMGFRSGATCGSAGIGAGPFFMTQNCDSSDDSPQQAVLPGYFIGALFRNYNSETGIPDGTTFDLSDPGHEQFITVMLNYQAITGPQYDYCTAPPTDLPDGGMYPASAGTVTVHQFLPDNEPAQTFTSDAELSNVVVPTSNGGPTLKVVSAHLYFQ